jgi:parvulin-like peptidyl-prolyl isomerase
MRYLTIFYGLLCIPAFGQTIDQVRESLQKINTQAEANEFVATYSGITAELFELNSGIDTTELDKKLIALGVGKIMEYGSADRQKNFFYKILEVSNAPSFRVQYIFLDGKELSAFEIDSTRSVILRRLRKGETFEKLAKLYSMDANGAKGGDLGWFSEGMMVKEFEDEIKKKNKGDVFTVDVASEKWYYVVRKSYDSRIDTKALIFYVEMSRD